MASRNPSWRLACWKSLTPRLLRNQNATPPGSALRMHAVLWQGDATRGTPPNSAPLSTARLSACLLKEGLFRDTGRRSAIASGGLSLGHLGLGLAKQRCPDQEMASTTNFNRVQQGF